MESSKPAIVIVPGAWHRPSHYRLLHDELRRNGYEVTTCALPSTESDEALPDFHPDIAVIRQAILTYLHRDLDVVLAMHSYGGTCGSSAPEGLLPKDRANGKGVKALAYMTALPIDKGRSLIGAGDNKYQPWCVVLGEQQTNTFCVVVDAAATFYHDCPEDVTAEALRTLKPRFNENSFHSLVPYAGWKDIDSWYLVCELDKAVPVAYQRMFATQEGGKWKAVESIQSGHSPFLSMPVETAQFIRRAAGEMI